jgi:predicted ATPase/DNA-binding winged helix-turn-helix (wHTH) protein
VYQCGTWQVDLGRRELLADGVAVSIGDRAFEIIEVLVQSADELVTKDDLMGRVWPNTIVGENTLQVHISAVRKALGPDRGMLKTLSGRGYRLLGGWRMSHAGTPATAAECPRDPTSVQPVQNNLPLGPELIGRTDAVSRLLDLASAYRLVTLTGPGGIGKSKLAVEVARALFSGFHGDVWLVDLASLADPKLVALAVTGVLGLEFDDERTSPASVAQAIGTRKVLLLLDNCEHVIDAAAKLTEAVMRLCPRACFLTTSRELLHVDGEHAFRVPPLDVPHVDTLGPDDVLRHSAVRLFIARTRAARFDFSPRDEDLTAISAICRRLDGIPLAIEFAAARAATLGLNAVLSHLDDRFRLLVVGRRTALPRHQTMRATLNWSYDLLPEPDQQLFRQLAVFAAGFTLDAAIAVSGDSGASMMSVEEGVANLAAKSLLTLDAASAPARWRLLETTRAYALEKLGGSGENDRIRQRHAAFFLEHFAPAGITSVLRPSTALLESFAREISNVRAALDWAFSPNGNAAIGVRLTAASVPFWVNLLLMNECRERVEFALQVLEPASRLDAHVSLELYQALGFALILTADRIGKTRLVLAKTLEIAESLDDLEAQLRALWAMWAHQANETVEAHAIAERFSAIARRGGDPADVLVGDRLLGYTLHYEGDQPRAREYLERVVAHYISQRDHRHMIWFHYDQRVLARGVLAQVFWLEGHVEQAVDSAHVTFDDARATNDILSQCFALAEAVCPIMISTGDLAAAARFLAVLLDLATEHKLDLWKNWGCCLEGKLLIRQGEFARGTAVLRAALDAFAGTGRQMRYPAFLGALAEGLAAGGRLTEGLETIGEALARAERDGERWCVPELLRVKGELLLHQFEDGSASAARDCFNAALGMARQQGALSWELRAATGFARLRIRQGRRDEARELLAPVYNRFTEGFETADLRIARALIEEDALS